jgi:hypothetical protein
MSEAKQNSIESSQETKNLVCQVALTDLCSSPQAPIQSKLDTPRASRNAHAYTPVIKQELKAWNIPETSMEEKEFKEILEEWRVKVQKANKGGVCPECSAALANVASRFTKDKDEKGEVLSTGKIVDPVLGNHNICFPIREIVKKCDEGILKETLHEIGTTCIQGVSHRVLYVYRFLI